MAHYYDQRAKAAEAAGQAEEERMHILLHGESPTALDVAKAVHENIFLVLLAWAMDMTLEIGDQVRAWRVSRRQNGRR